MAEDNSNNKKNYKRKKRPGFVKHVIIIAVILTVVFLSQQPYFEKIGSNLYSKTAEKTGPYWEKTSNLFKASIYPKASGEAVERGGALKEEVEKQKNNAAKSVWGRVKNYLAEKFSKISGTKVE